MQEASLLELDHLAALEAGFSVNTTRCFRWNGIGSNHSIYGSCFSGEICCFMSDSTKKGLHRRASILRELIGMCNEQHVFTKSTPNIYMDDVVLPHGYTNGSLVSPLDDEFMYSELTVHETLNFHNSMRPDATENEQNVFRLVKIMKLNGVLTQRISSLSPDQRRCLTISIELITGADVIIYDDFTSGLTSIQFANVLSNLKKMLCEYKPSCFIIIGVAALSFDEIQYVDRIQVISNSNALAGGTSIPTYAKQTGGNNKGNGIGNSNSNTRDHNYNYNHRDNSDSSDGSSFGTGSDNYDGFGGDLSRGSSGIHTDEFYFNGSCTMIKAYIRRCRNDSYIYTDGSLDNTNNNNNPHDHDIGFSYDFISVDRTDQGNEILDALTYGRIVVINSELFQSRAWRLFVGRIDESNKDLQWATTKSTTATTATPTARGSGQDSRSPAAAAGGGNVSVIGGSKAILTQGLKFPVATVDESLPLPMSFTEAAEVIPRQSHAQKHYQQPTFSTDTQSTFSNSDTSASVSVSALAAAATGVQTGVVKLGGGQVLPHSSPIMQQLLPISSTVKINVAHHTGNNNNSNSNRGSLGSRGSYGTGTGAGTNASNVANAGAGNGQSQQQVERMSSLFDRNFDANVDDIDDDAADLLLANSRASMPASPTNSSLLLPRLPWYYHPPHDISVLKWITRLGTQFYWCLWRSLIIRHRNLGSVLFMWLYVCILIPVGVMLTFPDLSYTQHGFTNRMGLLTVLPFVMTIALNLFFDQQMQDRNITAWDRNRNTHCPLFAMIANTITDLVFVKFLPPVIAASILYYPCNLHRTWSAFWGFLEALWVLCFTSSCFSRFTLGHMAIFGCRFKHIRASVQFASVMALMMVYSGIIVFLPTVPTSSVFLREWSLFYWGCNLLYYNDMKNSSFLIEGHAGQGDIYTLGSVLLESDGISELGRDRCLNNLLQQANAYLWLGLLLAWLFYRDWSRRSFMSDMYHGIRGVQQQIGS